MIPYYMAPTDFVHLVERIELEMHVGFDTGDHFVIFGLASLENH